MGKEKSKWLDRGLMVGPYYRLCLSETDFQAELDRLVPDKRKHPPFLSGETCNATTHFFARSTTSACDADMNIVCLGNTEDVKVEQVYGILIHEAVHIWQNFKDRIGETHPAVEQEAYAIQRIAQSLIWSYRKQKRKRKKEKIKENQQC